MLEVLARVWLPLVIVLVLAVGGYAVTRLHGAFGAQQRPSYAQAPQTDSNPAGAEQLVYEVFGPDGTVADINYFDVDTTPQQIDDALLPWSLTLRSDTPGVIGSIVAQGDSDSIGCRILVDGEIRAENISNQENAFTHCLVTGA